MAVITVFSIKGGVGKTTIATDLAWRWAQGGAHPTLLWDLDPQGGASFLTRVGEPQRHRAAAIFQRDGRPREAIVRSAFANLSLIPADPSLRQLPSVLPRLGPRRMQQMTSLLRSDYHRIVLDCPAGLSPLSEQALLAAVIRTAQENYLHAREPDGPRGDAPARQLDVELPDLISAAIATRALTVLWQREARYLNEADRADVRSRINTIVAGIDASVRLEFPDLDPRHSELRAWAVSSTMTSLGRHNLTLPRDDLTAVLRRACSAIIIASSPWAQRSVRRTR